MQSQQRMFLVPEQQTPFQADPSALHNILHSQPVQQQQQYIPGSTTNSKTPNKSNMVGYQNSTTSFSHQGFNNKENIDVNALIMMYSNSNNPKTPGGRNNSFYSYQGGAVPMDNSMNMSSGSITPGKSLRKESLCRTGEKKYLSSPKRPTPKQTRNAQAYSNSNNIMNTTLTNLNTSFGASSSMLNNSNMLNSNNHANNNRTTVQHNNAMNKSTLGSSNRISTHSNATKSSTLKRTNSAKRNNGKTPTQQKNLSQQQKKSAKKVANLSSDMNNFLTCTSSSTTLFDDDDTLMGNSSSVGGNGCDITNFLNHQLNKYSKNELRNILQNYLGKLDESVSNSSSIQNSSSNSSGSSCQFSSSNPYQDMNLNTSLNSSSMQSSIMGTGSNISSTVLSANLGGIPSFQTMVPPQQHQQQHNRSSIYQKYEPSDLIKKLLMEEESRSRYSNYKK